MIGYLFGKIFGTRNDRQLKRLRKVVSVINTLEPTFAAMNDDTLRQQSDIFRTRLAQGESLDSLLPEAFAVAREAGKRALKMRHFDVQLMGGMILHEGKISEMRTGEGKTLVATLPVYLNALTGNGVHVVTVNDYLARRDAAWMTPIYHALGLTVGAIHSGQPQEEKITAYRCDVTYGTNNEFGFDYLRDNMVLRVDERVQRGLSYAIIDEVDSILIDEARTPLIISGALQDTSQLYKRINSMVGKLRRQTEESPGHFSIDEKTRQVEMTEDGHQFLEQLLIRDGLLEADDNLYAPKNLSLLHHVNSALRAHYLFSRDIEYIVQNDQVVLIDEHSGRMMSGRRLAEGLHQALEAKEGVKIQNESQTLASTTFQNYFRLYKKLSGMTGTAETEAQEFYEIYRLDVVILPTNQVSRRQDLNDFIFMSKEEKFNAIIVDIRECVAKNSPVLVGTASVEMSEEMSRRLTKAGISHQVLNAKYHEKEAEIIAQAGRPGAVTVATNMAGRGTDIVLGGKWEAEIAGIENPTPEEIEQHRLAWQQRHDQVVAAGGLHILGTERHESRRIDNQLRGRAGRQGDPGLTRFYLSLEDDLMRIFASERMRGMMQAIGMNNGEAIEHRMVTKSIENAQRKVEGRNFDMRKQLLEFDDVANDQRQVIFGQRNDILEADDISDILRGVRADVVNTIMDDFIPPQSIEDQWDIPGLETHLRNELGLTLPVSQWLDEETDLHEEGLRLRISEALQRQYDERHAHAGELLKQVEKQIMLQVIDQSWKEHLSSMDQLRQGVYLRAYAQKNPKQEYKRESFEMFRDLLENIRYETVRVLSRIEIARREDIEAMEEKHRKEQENLRLRHEQAAAMGGGSEPDDQQDAAGPSAASAEQTAPFVREAQKVGRNDACPCGSGKKYKQCHGKLV